MWAGEDLVPESPLQDQESSEGPRETRAEAVGSSTSAEQFIS